MAHHHFRHAAGAAVLLAVLASCSSNPTYSSAPKNQDDICSIFAQRPEWRDAVAASARKWGAPVPVQMAIIWRESNFRQSVRPPKKYIAGFIPNGHVSSAYGYAQAIDGTWDWYREDTGNSGADRTDFDDAADFVGWYMAKTAAQNGVGMHDAYNQYLAYHEGHAGHRRGSYNAKGWLINVAGKVAGQAARYRGQLRGCSA
ncbi:MAG: transglycosylase SLT domain-containing protein [Pseudomonadota bacterium]